MLQCSRGKQICIPRCADLQIFAPQLDDYFSSAPYHSKVRRPPDNLRRAYPTEFRRQYVEGGCTSSAPFFTCSSRPKPPTSTPRPAHQVAMDLLFPPVKQSTFVRDRYKTVASRPGILTNRRSGHLKATQSIQTFGSLC